MQHRFGRERGFVIRDARLGMLGVPSTLRMLGVPLRQGAAHINNDAALAAHLHRRRRRTGDAHRPSLSRPYAGRAARIPHLPVPPPSHQHAERAVPSALPALVSDPRHLSHRPALCLTNTDISSVPYKTP